MTSCPQVNLFGQQDTSMFFLLKNRSKRDTLFVKNIGHGFYDYGLIWKKDTIVKDLHYGSIHGFIGSIDTLQWSNLFLLNSSDAGDGCPVLYRLLAFKDNTDYFLSELFGNCNGLDRIKYYYPKMSFYFEGFREANRKRTHFIFDTQKYTLTKK